MSRHNYIQRLVLVILIVFAVCASIYQVIIKSSTRYCYAMYSNDFLFNRDTTNYDVILLGSSRMKHGIDPIEFQKITGKTAYNTGQNGINMMEIKAILEAYLLTHKAPKYAVLCVDYFSLNIKNNLRIPANYIVCSALPPFERELKYEGLPVKLLNAIPFFKLIALDDYYKGMVFKVLRHQYEHREGVDAHMGYVANGTGSMTDSIPDNQHFADTAYLTAQGVETLSAFIAICRQKAIKLIWVYIPEFPLYRNRIFNFNSVMRYYDSLSVVYNIPYFHGDHLALSRDPAFFVNAGHLNEKGAHLYTILLSKQMVQNGLLR